MVKSVLGVNHQGLQDWMIQRVSAILMALYMGGLMGFVFAHPQLSFSEWQGLFGHLWMKVLTILVLVSLLWHAWVGMWTIFTDYVKPFVLRAFLDVVVILALIACFIWGVLIVWSA